MAKSIGRIILLLLVFSALRWTGAGLPVRSDRAVVSAAGTLDVRLAASASTVHPGKSFLVTVRFANTAAVAPGGIAAFDLVVTYDASRVEFVEALPGAMASSGELDAADSGEGSLILLYLDADGGQSPIAANRRDIADLRFRVRPNAARGSLAFGGTFGSGGDNEANPVTGTLSPLSITVGAPLSDNADLSSLSAAPGVLAPAFSPDVLSYTVSVPFEIDRLSVEAAAEDPKARIDISDPELVPGGTTTLTITVTAEDPEVGKVYRIRVDRAAPSATPSPPETPTQTPFPSATPVPTLVPTSDTPTGPMPTTAPGGDTPSLRERRLLGALLAVSVLAALECLLILYLLLFRPRFRPRSRHRSGPAGMQRPGSAAAGPSSPDTPGSPTDSDMV